MFCDSGVNISSNNKIIRKRKICSSRLPSYTPRDIEQRRRFVAREKNIILATDKMYSIEYIFLHTHKRTWTHTHVVTHKHTGNFDKYA